MLKKISGYLIAAVGFILLVFTMVNRNKKEGRAGIEKQQLKREYELKELEAAALNVTKELREQKEKELSAISVEIDKTEKYIADLELETNEIIILAENKLRKVQGNQAMDSRLGWLRNSKYTPGRFTEPKPREEGK